MPDRKQQAGKSTRTALVLGLLTLAVILCVAPCLVRAQDTQNLITVIYGNGNRLLIKDWNFVYKFYESDVPIVFCWGCTIPLLQTKTSKDLHLVEVPSGSDSPIEELVIFQQDELEAIRFNLKKYSGSYDTRGRIVRRAIPGSDEVEDVSIVSVQGSARIFETLRAPELFVSDKEYVYMEEISIAGWLQGKAIPELFELKLNLGFVPTPPREHIVEIRFREYD